MKKISRLTAILVELQTHTYITSVQLCQKFNVSQRTIYRDINALQEAGIPIGATPNKGFFLVDGFKLPPLTFTEEELYAMQTAEVIIKQNSDSSLVNNFTGALSKIRAALKQQSLLSLQFIEQQLSPSSAKTTANTSSWLTSIQKAIANSYVIQIVYISISKEERTERRIEPIGIYFTDKNWVVVAYCQLKKDYREFRLDRIIELGSIQTLKFIPKITLEKYFAKIIS